MMDQKKQGILNRIVKLLALSIDQQGTPEGDTAEDAAARLMMKYSISEAELQAAKFDSGNEEVLEDEEGLDILFDEKRKVNQWFAQTAISIGSTFGCKVYLSSYKGTVHFVGLERDIETCTYFAVVLKNFMEAKAWELFPNSYAKRGDFYFGAWASIHDRLQSMKAAMKDVMEEHVNGELIVLKDQLVAKEYAALSERLGFTKRKPPKVSKNLNRDAYLAGAAAGKNAPMNLGISK